MREGTLGRCSRSPEKETDMPILKDTKTTPAKVTDKDRRPPAGVDDGSMADEKQKSKPNEPDPEEVQYPDYFKGKGSL
jgi:hypothetical protein